MTNKKQGTTKKGSTVIDKGLFKWYWQTPNLIDDTPMSVNAFRLYGHLKRIESDTGHPQESICTMALRCGICRGTVLKAKKELLKLGLIKIVKIKSQHQGGASDMKIMTDINTFINRSKQRNHE